MTTIKGHADGLEADPVWETPIPDEHADTVAAILEAVREDWRDAPAPASGYRLELAYDTDTGAFKITMGAADPNEEPPADLIAPLPIRRAQLSDYWPEGPYDHEAAAAGLPDDAAERIEAALGIDRSDPATAALIEAVENDGLDFGAARAEAERRARAVADSIPTSLPLDALPAGAEMAAILRANGMDPDNYRIAYGPPAPYEPPTREEHQP